MNPSQSQNAWRVGPYYGPDGVWIPPEPAPEMRPWLWGLAIVLVGGAALALAQAARTR
jgi:hypothetical protein